MDLARLQLLLEQGIAASDDRGPFTCNQSHEIGAGQVAPARLGSTDVCLLVEWKNGAIAMAY